MAINRIAFTVILLAVLSVADNSFAQLNKDIQYLRGNIVSVDHKKNILVLREGGVAGQTKTFDISQARRNGELIAGQDVFVIVPVNSNKAKSIRIIVEKK